MSGYSIIAIKAGKNRTWWIASVFASWIIMTLHYRIKIAKERDKPKQNTKKKS